MSGTRGRVRFSISTFPVEAAWERSASDDIEWGAATKDGKE
jgi:hypothetical protein